MMKTRRQFLQKIAVGAAGVVASPYMPRFFFEHAHAQDRGRHIFVIIQGGGGWDGNHWAQPISGVAYDACLAARPTLTRNPDALLPVQGVVGLHPQLRFLHESYLAGELAFSTTAGIPTNNSGSHEVATGHALRGMSDGDRELPKGFFARALDARYPNGGAPEFLGFDFTSGNSVFLDSGNRILKASSITNYGFNGNFDNFTQGTIYAMIDRAGRSASEARVVEQMRSLQNTQADLRSAVQGTTFNPTFPTDGFGSACRQAFVAIANFADRGLSAITMGIGGWDTHNMQDPATQQGQPLQGMSANLSRVDGGLRALVANLKRSGMYDRVTILSLTEFGRTARENGGRGTDHGKGTYMFIMGGKVNGGQILGSLVDPSDFTSNSNSFKVTVPYAAVLAQCGEHMGILKEAVYPPEVLAALPQLPPLFRA